MKSIRMFALLVFLLTSCSPSPTQPVLVPTSTIQAATFSPADASTPTKAGLPNPASSYCEEQGYRLEIRTAVDGSQSGVCVFPDGNECDEWAYFRGECIPSLASPTPQAEDMGNGWKRFTDYGMRFSFEYPADATIEVDGYTVSVNGPIVENNVWPVFLVSHPDDRAEYRVPADVDLRQWLIDHNLYVDQPQPDRVIADTTAVHVRFQGGQQSVANDRYYFVHNNQIFLITILHTGKEEDWALYDHFLDSFQFEQTFSAAQPSLPTVPAIEPADYQGWWTYTHGAYGFSIMLPEDWVMEEITTFDPIMNGHSLNLHPREIAPDVTIEKQNIRMTFRRTGEDALLWPTGIGVGECVEQGTLVVDGQPAQRIALVCPNGYVTSIWYHDGDGQPNITRGDMEFGFIYNAGGPCESGLWLNGKIQHVGEMIIASLRVP
jgi:putative hemolysin